MVRPRQAPPAMISSSSSCYPFILLILRLELSPASCCPSKSRSNFPPAFPFNEGNPDKHSVLQALLYAASGALARSLVSVSFSVGFY